MRHISRQGIDLICRFEGFSPIIYMCPAGYPTIGYGHLINEANKEQFLDGVDEDEALDLLRQDVAVAERAVLRLLDKSNLQVDMTKLGFEGDDMEVFIEAIHQPQGMVQREHTADTGRDQLTKAMSDDQRWLHPDGSPELNERILHGEQRWLSVRRPV